MKIYAVVIAKVEGPDTTPEYLGDMVGTMISADSPEEAFRIAALEADYLMGSGEFEITGQEVKANA